MALTGSEGEVCLQWPTMLSQLHYLLCQRPKERDCFYNQPAANLANSHPRTTTATSMNRYTSKDFWGCGCKAVCLVIPCPCNLTYLVLWQDKVDLYMLHIYSSMSSHCILYGPCIPSSHGLSLVNCHANCTKELIGFDVYAPKIIMPLVPFFFKSEMGLNRRK